VKQIPEDGSLPFDLLTLNDEKVFAKASLSCGKGQISVAQRWTLDFVGRKCPVLATYLPGSMEFAVGLTHV